MQECTTREELTRFGVQVWWRPRAGGTPCSAEDSDTDRVGSKTPHAPGEELSCFGSHLMRPQNGYRNPPHATLSSPLCLFASDLRQTPSSWIAVSDGRACVSGRRGGDGMGRNGSMAINKARSDGNAASTRLVE